MNDRNEHFNRRGFILYATNLLMEMTGNPQNSCSKEEVDGFSTKEMEPIKPRNYSKRQKIVVLY